MIPNPSSDPLRRLHSPLVPEIKAEIGAALKAARLKRGQSLESVSQQTRISKRFLEALEENRFEDFPALAYLRGFLKSYCDHLELDFDAFWRAIQNESAPAQAAPAADHPAPSSKPAPKPAPAHDHAHAPAHPSPRAAAHSADPSAPWRVLGVAVVLAGAVAAVLSRGGSAPAPEAESAAPPALLQPVGQPAEPHLAIEFRQDAWISVETDGRTVFEGKVPRNTRQEWKARKAIVLRTPSPEALQLTRNGARIVLPAADASGAYRIESP